MIKLLLCTDMDRTIIPNGHQPEHPQARETFRQLCSLPGITLAYVTGRDLELMQKAIATYQLPLPAYAITDVGTQIYTYRQGQWQELTTWQELIGQDWKGKTHQDLKAALADLAELRLQEPSKQKRFKLSYYVQLEVDHAQLLKTVETRLVALGVEASLIWSIDEPENIGLLDILPLNATKMHGIEFLQRYLELSLDELLFAGDSGNDLMVMASPIRSILVANADAATQQQALQLARENNVEESLYLATDTSFPLGGNYSAGVLQGVGYFAPEVMAALF